MSLLSKIRQKLRVWLGVVDVEKGLDERYKYLLSKGVKEAYIDKKLKSLEDRVAHFVNFDNSRLRGEVGMMLDQHYREIQKMIKRELMN